MFTQRDRRNYYRDIACAVAKYIDYKLGSGHTLVGTIDNDVCNVLERLEILVDMRIESPTTKSTANDQQVDGNHYQTEIQPWDFIEANKLTFIEGNIVKYVSRHRKKNGVRDLMKAKHYLEKLIEIEQSKSLGDNNDDTEN